MGLKKRSENIRIQWNENRIPEKVGWESSSVPAVLLETGDFLFPRRRPNKQLAAAGKVLSLFLSVGFEIIVDSADWMKAENGGIQTTGCAFRGAAAGNFSDLERNLVKLKTLGAGVGVFNGTVRTEREFPLKILFLACAQGFVVLFITRNGAEISRSRSPNTIYSRFVF